MRPPGLCQVQLREGLLTSDDASFNRLVTINEGFCVFRVGGMQYPQGTVLNGVMGRATFSTPYGAVQIATAHRPTLTGLLASTYGVTNVNVRMCVYLVHLSSEKDDH